MNNQAKLSMTQLVPGFHSRVGELTRLNFLIKPSDWMAKGNNEKDEYIRNYLIERLCSAELELVRTDSGNVHFAFYPMVKS